jgi:hypothetical protein
MTKSLIWTAGQIRAAAKVAKEQNVVIKLEADGSLRIIPILPDDTEKYDKGRGYL